MFSIGTQFSQTNFSIQAPSLPPSPHGHRGCHHHQVSSSSGIQSPAYWGQLANSSNSLFSGWQSFGGLGTSTYANPGFNTAYTNPGFNTSFTHPGFGLNSGEYNSGVFGSASFDYSSFATSMFQGSSLLNQSLGYNSGLSGLGLGSMGYGYPSLSSTSAFPYDLMMQGMPSIPMF